MGLLFKPLTEAAIETLEAIPGPVVVCGEHDDRVWYANQRARVLLELSDAQPPMRWSQLHFSNEEYAHYMQQCARSHDVELRVRYRTARGRVFWGMVNSAPLPGEPGCRIVLMRDVTTRVAEYDQGREQEAFNEALRDVTRTLTSTLNQDEVLDYILANVGRVVPHDSANIMLLDADGQALRLVRTSGYDRRAPDEQPLVGTAFPLSTTDNLREIVVSQLPLIVGETREYTGWVQLPQAKWIRSFLGAPIRSMGRVVGIVGLDSATTSFFTEAHAERLMAFADQAAIAIENARLFAEAERARDAAQAANNAKSAFLATMSHEIRTPMNAVLGMATMLMDTELAPEQQEYVETIRMSGDLLLSIINDVLDFSKIESGRLELEALPFALAPCVEGTVDLLAHRAQAQGLVLSSTIAPEAPAWIVGDATRLRQVLLNLVSNAVKFTERGQVEIVVDVESQHPLVLHFSVRDTGIGIPRERIGQLFQLFSQLDASTTRRYGGTGLGLAICRRLTEMMGGRMWVESSSVCGSTFHFTIVAEAVMYPPAVAQTTQPPLLAQLAAVTPCQILLVEDNIINQKVALRLLSRLGYQADVAQNGAVAIEILKQRAYDLVLMDLHMPELDGLQATRTIRQMLPADRQPVVVAMTAAVLVEDQQACLAAGMNAFITKPIRTEQLVEVLQSFCSQRR